MVSLTSILEKARRMPFQEIADSPTIRYYTNWKAFEARLEKEESTTYKSLPRWIENLSMPKVVLTNTVEGDYLNVEEVGKGYNVAEDIGVEGKLELYNTARLTTGALIKLEGEGTQLLLASLGGDGFTGHHVKIIVEPYSDVEIVFLDIGGYKDSIKLLTVSIIIGERAKAKIVTLADHGQATTYTRRVFRLGRASQLTSKTLVSSGEATRFQDDYRVEGVEAALDSKVSGISLANRWGDVVVNAIHTGERSRGIVGGRGVVLPGGTLVMRGLAMIMPQAQWSSSKVDVHVASLGEGAKAYATPTLEIHTGNVEEAYHSASVSSLSEESLFYLASRGLSEEEAKALLVDGAVSYSGVLEELGLALDDIVRSQ